MLIIYENGENLLNKWEKSGEIANKAVLMQFYSFLFF